MLQLSRGGGQKVTRFSRSRDEAAKIFGIVGESGE